MLSCAISLPVSSFRNGMLRLNSDQECYQWLLLDIQNLFIFTAADVLPCGGRAKSTRTLVLIWRRLYFLVLWDHWFYLSHYEYISCLSRCHGGMASAAYIITGYEETGSSGVCYFL